MGILKGETYTDGYGNERKQLSNIEKAINTVKSYLKSAKQNYTDLTKTPGLGMLYPSNAVEVTMAMVPAAKIGNLAEYFTKIGMKIDSKLLFQPWFKDMANGSWTGQSGALTKAAKEAKREFWFAKNKTGMTNIEAGEAAASRFRYLMERTPIDEAFKQGGILKRK